MARGRTAPRLVDVAERAGVSLATASRALSGRDGVSPGVARRVQDVAAELGYVVNAHARSLAGGSVSVVGLIVHQIDDPYFSEIAAGVISVAHEHGITVQICHSARDPENELHQIRTLIANNVRAIIVAGSGYVGDDVESAAKRELTAFQEAGGRVAVIGRHALRADAVLPDNEDAGAALAEHLVGLGHRRIAIATGTVNLTTVVDRLAGIERALSEHGIDIDDLPLIEAEFTRDGGAFAAERILAEHPGSTAIIALNDAMAIGALATLRAHGVAVPAQVSVVGFDDVSVAADLAPSLTTVRLPMTGMGKDALMMALKEPSSRPRRRHTGHELMVRDSSGPAPA